MPLALLDLRPLLDLRSMRLQHLALLHADHLNLLRPINVDPGCLGVLNVRLRSGLSRMHGNPRPLLLGMHGGLRPWLSRMHGDARLLHPHLRLMLDRRDRRLPVGHDLRRRRRDM